MNRRPPAPSIRAAVLLVCIAVPGLAQDPAVDAERGRALYLQHCAKCHGPEGKGDGPQKVFPPARNFQHGGFSFGSTKQALFRTIGSGIPGTAMVSFADVLSPADRAAVADHVLSLVPESVREVPVDSRLLVQDVALVAHGYYRPARERGAALGRVLALGLPGGYGFFFRTDDLRLLEVRRGPFLDRADWRDRGGAPFEALGRPFKDFGAAPPPAYGIVDGSSAAPLRAVVRATEVRSARVAIQAELVATEGGAAVASVEISPKIDTVREAMGYSLEFVVSGAGERTISLLLPNDPEATVKPVHGFPTAGVAVSPLADPEHGTHWFVSRLAEGGFEGVHVQAPSKALLVRGATGWSLALPGGGRAKVSVVRFQQWTPEFLDDLHRDLL